MASALSRQSEEALEKAWIEYRRQAFNVGEADRGVFESGWDAALTFDRPCGHPCVMSACVPEEG